MKGISSANKNAVVGSGILFCLCLRQSKCLVKRVSPPKSDTLFIEMLFRILDAIRMREKALHSNPRLICCKW